MNKLLLPALLAGAVAPAAAAQAPVTAKLYTRTADGVVRAAIDLEIEPGWHLYHKELGHPRAIGQKTVVELSGNGIEWGEVRFPKPRVFDQSDLEEGVFILGHEGHLTLYAAGRLAPGATGDGIEASIRGLVCEVSCIPYRATLTPEGPGPDALFLRFPADLLPGDPDSGASSASVPQETARDTPPTPSDPPVPTRDVKEGGHADATLYTRVTDGEVRAVLRIAIEPGWHLYHVEKGNPDGIGKPTRIVLHGRGVRWGEPVWPEPKKIDQSDVEKGLWIYGHEGTIDVRVSGELEPGASGEGIWFEIHGQTCDEDSCVNYAETVVSRGPGPDELFQGFVASSAGAGANGSDDGLGAFLLLAVFWGFFTLLMPCTYPMIPITISFFTKQAEARGGKVWPLSLAYGAGIIAVFILIGVAFGSVIIPFATHWLTNLVIGILFLYFAFVLFGVVDLQPPRFLMQAAGEAQKKGGYLGVFLMGTTLVVTSFTCTAPFVGSLLSVGAKDGNLARIVLGMGVFGLTMAVPFVLLSLVPGRLRAMPRGGEWMNTLKKFMGFVELAAALKFFSNTDVVRDWRILSREVFLLAWGLIFAAAALYLLLPLVRRRPGSPGPRPARLVSGLFTAAFAGYCLVGFSGGEMDRIMTAIIPPYSGGRLLPALHDETYDWTIVENDYDRARELALAQDKLLLINFTGYT